MSGNARNHDIQACGSASRAVAPPGRFWVIHRSMRSHQSYSHCTWGLVTGGPRHLVEGTRHRRARMTKSIGNLRHTSPMDWRARCGRPSTRFGSPGWLPTKSN